MPEGTERLLKTGATTLEGPESCEQEEQEY